MDLTTGGDMMLVCFRERQLFTNHFAESRNQKELAA